MAALLTLALTVTLTCNALRREGEQELLQTLGEAYPQLAACPDFTRMRPEEGGLRLYLTDGTEQVVPLPAEVMAHFERPWWRRFRLLGGWKAGDDVYFITGGAVDDCWGYVVSGDASVGTEGLNVLRRAGGHVCYFSTMAE